MPIGSCELYYVPSTLGLRPGCISPPNRECLKRCRCRGTMRRQTLFRGLTETGQESFQMRLRRDTDLNSIEVVLYRCDGRFKET